MTNGWPAPASQELGANWVEVTALGVGREETQPGTRNSKNVASNSALIWFRRMVTLFPGRRCFS